MIDFRGGIWDRKVLPCPTDKEVVAIRVDPISGTERHYHYKLVLTHNAETYDESMVLQYTEDKKVTKRKGRK